MTPFHYVISNFEKKNSSIVNKRLFLPDLCKKWNLKAILKYAFKVWCNGSEKNYRRCSNLF